VGRSAEAIEACAQAAEICQEFDAWQERGNALVDLAVTHDRIALAEAVNAQSRAQSLT